MSKSARNISRRQFILATITLLVYFLLLGNYFISDERYIQRIVKKKIWYLDFKKIDLTKFSSDVLGVFPANRIKAMKFLNAFNILLWPLIAIGLIGKIEQLELLETEIAKIFLMSSNIFQQNRKDSSVQYLGLYLRDRVACANPFAEFD